MPVKSKNLTSLSFCPFFEKAAKAPSRLSRLLRAKVYSDLKRYQHKNAILRKMMEEHPEEFIVDDPQGDFHGITHVPTKFRLHVDPKIIPAGVVRVPVPQQLTRYESGGRGTWSAGKEEMPEELLQQILEAKGWLKRPKLPEGEYTSYFTPSGTERYEKTLLPLHEKYLPEITRSQQTRPSTEPAYEDEYQVLYGKSKATEDDETEAEFDKIGAGDISEPRVRFILPYEDQHLLQEAISPKWKGWMRHAGGGIEEDETPEEAALREFEEEFGTKLKPEQLKYLGIDPREEFAKHHFYEVMNHGLAPNRFQASNDPDEIVQLVKALQFGDKYLGPDVANIKTAAVGIPSREDYGDISKVQKGQLLDWIIQHHLAERAGPHYDVRFGDKDQGLHSWVMPKELPTPKQRRLMIHQPLHSHEHGQFSGKIHEGYGKGTVKKHTQGQILVTKVYPGSIHFTTAHQRHPERFALIKTKKGSRDWLLINTTPTDPVPYRKIRLKRIPREGVEEAIDQMEEGASVQAKVDGASSLIRILKDGVELVSYRAAKATGRPILHTERFFGGRPKKKMPSHLVGTILRGELYGLKGKGVIHPSELGGILNAALAKSLAKQREGKIQLRNMIFDIQQLGKDPVDFDKVPYRERRKMIEQVMEHLPGDQFHLSEEATTPETARKLWETIQKGKHPLTREGVVIHPATGKPMKGKLMEESDVHVTGIFPGEGKYKDRGAGGFGYSLESAGPEVGRVGTGLSDAVREELYKSPKDFIGRIARIRSQEQFPSGAWRTPAFLSWHEDYPLAEAER